MEAKDRDYPTSKTGAAVLLTRAGAWVSIGHVSDTRFVPRDYNDHKAKQLLEALADNLISEARIASWFIDLGFNGACQGEDSSIGGVPCHSSQEIS